MSCPTICRSKKPCPNLRAGLLALRREILDNAVRVQVYVLNPDGTRTPCEDYAKARLNAFARSWGDFGSEYWAIERVFDSQGRSVCRNHERFLVEVAP